jgi:hypothetical protein
MVVIVLRSKGNKRPDMGCGSLRKMVFLRPAASDSQNGNMSSLRRPAKCITLVLATASDGLQL